jgi:hypothetical protein
MEINLTPSVRENDIALGAEVRKIDADGSLGDVLRSGSVGDSIREKIAASIGSAIRKTNESEINAARQPWRRGQHRERSVRRRRCSGCGSQWREVRMSAEQLRLATGQ